MKTFLSFIGTNDAGTLIGKKDGAILTALSNEKFDEVILLWNEAIIKDERKYSDVLIYLKREIKKRKLAKKIQDYEITIKDVTDHNEIYEQLKEFTDSLDKKESIDYTAAISSGTPSMQVCWILLAESGDFSMDFPLRIIKVTDPKFGKSKNIDVKLNTSLPRIIGLKKELDDIKNDLIPSLELNIVHGSIKVGEVVIPLSPVEFCYYRYFLERCINDEELEKFSGYNVSKSFIKEIFSYHEESFPDLELNRLDMEKMLRKDFDLPITTFRGHISKINRKLSKSLRNESLFNTFQIQNEGIRGAKFYGLRISKEKIKVV